MQTNQQFSLYKGGEMVCWFETKQHNCLSSLESFNLKKKYKENVISNPGFIFEGKE